MTMLRTLISVVYASRHMSTKSHHVPVMAQQVYKWLNLQPGQTLLDMTFGAGGHTEYIMSRIPDITVYGLDRDPVAHELSKEMARTSNGKIVPLLGRFSEIEKIMEENGIQPGCLDGVLIDAGCSSMQFDTASRGFALSMNGPLDMRMDGERFPDMPTAADIVNHADEYDLAKIFKTYGDEKLAKKIATAIVESRYMLRRGLRTTQELANFVADVCGVDRRLDKLQRSAHVATKIFQALRICVNDELNELDFAVQAAYKYLRPGGRLVTLTFHSLEDRIVKEHLWGLDVEQDLKFKSALNVYTEQEVSQIRKDYLWEVLQKHSESPTNAEIERNPRSRSASLRVAQKRSS